TAGARPCSAPWIRLWERAVCSRCRPSSLLRESGDNGQSVGCGVFTLLLTSGPRGVVRAGSVVDDATVPLSLNQKPSLGQTLDRGCYRPRADADVLGHLCSGPAKYVSSSFRTMHM